ncbi:interleukin-27 receptor subunit alpha isoform X2 [Ranitomeya imitator]|uniref:interleukin-27 receptor subunit alpha isoform X2 n=1 Tax=Ranitomeya imitator TaxID=111125 RepID=UPI0037E87B43
MSYRRWVISLFRGLLVLNLSYMYGFFDDSSVFCVIRDQSGDLNCSWRSDVWTEHSASLQNLTHLHEPPLFFTIPAGQNWLLIKREILVRWNEYLITVSAGGRRKTIHFTYGSHGHHSRPPLLNSSISGSHSLEITWKHPEDEVLDHPPVELRYRIMGAENWTEVENEDLEINNYILDEPAPFTQYEFQIRYLPEGEKKGSVWSTSHVLMSPEMAPNGSCDVWRSLEDGSSLLLMWKALEHRSAKGRVLYEVTSVHGGESTTEEVPCCSSVLPAQSTQVCITARNSKGVGPPACVTPPCTEIINGTGSYCKVSGDSSGKINVFCDARVRSDDVLNYVIEWREVREDEKTQVHWTRRQALSETVVLPGNFTPGIPYYISVNVIYNNSCIRIFSTEAYRQEEVPTAAPNFTCHHLSDRNILVSWEEIPRLHRRGIISHYTIYINSTNTYKCYTVSNGSGNKTISGLLSETVYTIWMTASTRAGEGQSSPLKIFPTSGKRHHVLLIVPMVVIILLVCGTILCFFDCKTQFWPKIPKPEDKFKKLFMASNVNMWQPHQVSLNPLIAVVEEIEPPPQPPTPPPPPKPSPPSTPLNKPPIITSGYEKHFMPTPEEVMGLS